MEAKFTQGVCGSLLCAALFTHTAVFAGDERAKGFYIQGNLGEQWYENTDFVFDELDGISFPLSIDSSMWGEIKAGYRWGRSLRTSLSYSLDGKSDVTSDGCNDAVCDETQLETTLQTQALLFNAYVDLFPALYFLHLNKSPLQVYIGGGVGASMNELGEITATDANGNVSSVDGDHTIEFAWRLEAGVDYRFTDHFYANVAYMYMDAGKAQSGNSDATWSHDVRSNIVSAGLGYYF